MYLKSIKAQGFKSFADKLDLEINPGITGIVGPNGSGKSNIVDAVRWVLGEQSVKSLRATYGMTDVIFSGSESRQPQKRAMVALTFDNTDHYLQSEFEELEIKRVLYASGENEYYINNTRVRLKDITNLFVDSGAGTSAFNIISQGNVTDIVNSKSQDRRVIFESAAGVLKYKKRKEESLKKLEKTEDNLNGIKLVIDELEKSIKPLEAQRKKACEYLQIKEELETIDIALIVKDIQDLNLEYSTLQVETKSLKDKLLNVQHSDKETKLEKLKLKSITLEEQIDKLKESLLNKTEEISNLNSEKKLTIERQKYEVNSNSFDETLVNLKEQELNLKRNIELKTKENEDIEASILKEQQKLEEVRNKLIVTKVKRSTANNNVLESNKKLFFLQNKIEILENNILNSENVPSAVRNVLNNPRLSGIHDTLGKLLNTDDKYITALDIAMGASSNYIIVESDEAAIKAIDFLKERKLGRATFLPLNVIKPRYIKEEVIDSIKNIKGYIGILSKLVTFDKKYTDIIENQLGRVIVVDNASTLNIVGKLIDYKYVIVSLDGEILHVGGSITGGTSKKQGMLNEKNELKNLKTEESTLKVSLNDLNESLNNLNKEIEELEDKETIINKYINLLNDELFNKKTNLSHINEEYNNVISELNGIENIKSNGLEKRLVTLMEQINKLVKEKEIIESDIKNLSKEKSNIADEITILEKEIKDNNTIYNTYNNELKNKEISIGKIEVKLDNLLDNLNNDYNITFEYAQVNYSLDLSVDLARDKVSELKSRLIKLGEVNTGSIAEYERVSERYNFLSTQKNDLESASQELRDIIKEMDEIMVNKFSNSFKDIQKEFSRIFKLMFKGGKGELTLSDPNDLLNTGIDIVVSPPGKKINSPLSLSGGEKALTAICLLFAMLEVKPSPFVILDEAEAALDEVNVDMFGKYLREEKKNSQFIIITHKKRMMEYADILYGITMQESGVSKIVSAKLEEK